MHILRTIVTASGSIAVAVLLSGCVPSEAVAPPPEAMDEGAAEQIMETVLDDQWAAVGLPEEQRPDIARERVIEAHEWPTQIAACLSSEGFTGVKVGADGGIESGPVPQDQQSAYNLAMYVCNARFPVAAIYNTALNESQLNYIYEYFRSTLIPCLSDHGYEIEEPPSRDSFVEGYGPSGWSPYISLSGDPKLVEVQEKCPALPDGLYRDDSK